MFNIIVVEDDKNTRKLLSAVLRGNGYNVIAAQNGAEALDLLAANHVDLAIVDIMMPELNGYELTKAIRDGGIDIPVLVVSALDAPDDKYEGFRVGVDDYMTKPVDEEEMLLRIKALLRRYKIATDHKLHIGKVTLDYDTLTVTRENDIFTLPKKEFYLLFKLLSYPDKIFTRYQLMDEIWGLDSNTDEHTVNVHINRLRSKFESYPEFEILTLRGLGFKAVYK